MPWFLVCRAWVSAPYKRFGRRTGPCSPALWLAVSQAWRKVPWFASWTWSRLNDRRGNVFQNVSNMLRWVFGWVKNVSQHCWNNTSHIIYTIISYRKNILISPRLIRYLGWFMVDMSSSFDSPGPMGMAWPDAAEHFPESHCRRGRPSRCLSGLRSHRIEGPVSWKAVERCRCDNMWQPCYRNVLPMACLGHWPNSHSVEWLLPKKPHQNFNMEWGGAIHIKPSNHGKPHLELTWSSPFCVGISKFT